MRAMWTAASGMQSLQMDVDTISNNLANVNTIGYKSQRMEFQDLFYEKMLEDTFQDGEGKPVSIELGHGVMPISTLRSFEQGGFQNTENDLDFAIQGDGFFVVKNVRGEEEYTRDGSFKISVEEGNSVLVTSNGYRVQGIDGDIDLGADVADVSVDFSGNVVVKRDGSDESETVGQIKLVEFVNPAGLESLGKNFYKNTAASGDAVESENGSAGEVWQGFIEMSNVSVVKEMVKLITAQRAYEINSKSVQTADRMLEVANSLKR